MAGLLILLAIGLGLFVLLCAAATIRGLTRPRRKGLAWALARQRPESPAAMGLASGSWTFRSRGLDLPVWDIGGRDAAGPIAIITHGWGDSRLGSLARIGPFLPACSRVILWDLPGHGEAPGRCALGLREAEDLAALLDHIEPERPVVLMGVSLGAGLSIAAACDRPEVVGVIAEAPYRLAATPARNVLRITGMPTGVCLWLALRAIAVRHRSTFAPRAFDRAVHAARLAGPLLVIHGEADEICPPRDGHDIASAPERGRLVLIPDAGHNNLWTDPAHAAACTASIEAFLGALRPTITADDAARTKNG